MSNLNVTASLINKLALLSMVLLLSACESVHNFTMNDSYHQLKNVQILDPDASERNDGLVLSLEGNYGRQVMLKYRQSSEAPISAKEMGSSSIIMD
ncbi:hypothetical protein [Shewanella sp. UCD-KL21]|uniref:hypothetical protein n=2 Tax=Shewanella TaxID=22 RepID=UPI000970B1A0|nr:hypothetical protein [Shewanella sp. UCD-KL21]